MKMLVFSTKREIREYVKQAGEGFLPKLYTIGEFLEKAAVVKNRALIDGDLKKVMLYRAFKGIDALKLGFEGDFFSFFKNAKFVLSFFNEVYLEKKDIRSIFCADMYAEYEEHLLILQKLYSKYCEILDKNGYYDRCCMTEYKINEKMFENVKSVEIFLSGYLSASDLEIISKIPCDVFINFRVTPYNARLVKKMFGSFKNGEYLLDFKRMQVVKHTELKPLCACEVVPLSNRMEQAEFVFAAIEELVNEGISPDNIAVVLPDEGFSEYLRVLDIKNNLNFAMGEGFWYSRLYIMLQSVFDYVIQKDKTAYNRAKSYIKEFEALKEGREVLEFVLKHAAPRERRVLDEEIYKISRFKEIGEYTKEEVLHFLLERFKNLTFDDVRGGKVTVMGVLESRGMKYDGVVLVDFNEGFVPSTAEGDYFLNTAIREKVSLPTRADKESLQKNYYYNILLNAKKAKISYVKNEESEVSRFFYELGLKESKKEGFYSGALFKPSKKRFYRYDERFEMPKTLTPTSLKTLLECPMKYYFSYVLKIRNESEEENFGSLLHRALQEALVTKPADEGEYFERIMENLLKNRSKKEEFEIRSFWEERLREFAKIDYPLLEGKILTEAALKPAVYKNITLKARADRIVGNRIYDYKTSSGKDYLKDTTQAEFYAYLFKGAEVFFWDLVNLRLEKPEINPLNLEKKIDSLLTETKKQKGDHCRFCEYAFACLDLET